MSAIRGHGSPSELKLTSSALPRKPSTPHASIHREMQPPCNPKDRLTTSTTIPSRITSSRQRKDVNAASAMTTFTRAAINSAADHLVGPTITTFIHKGGGDDATDPVISPSIPQFRRDISFFLGLFAVCVLCAGLVVPFFSGSLQVTQKIGWAWQVCYREGWIAIPPPLSMMMAIPTADASGGVAPTMVTLTLDQHPLLDAAWWEGEDDTVPSFLRQGHSSWLETLVHNTPSFSGGGSGSTMPPLAATFARQHLLPLAPQKDGIMSQIGQVFALTLHSRVRYGTHLVPPAMDANAAAATTTRLGPEQRIVIPWPVMRTFLLGNKYDSDATFVLPPSLKNSLPSGNVPTETVSSGDLFEARLSNLYTLSSSSTTTTATTSPLHATLPWVGLHTVHHDATHPFAPITSPSLKTSQSWQQYCSEGTHACMACQEGSLPVALAHVHHPTSSSLKVVMYQCLPTILDETRGTLRWHSSAATSSSSQLPLLLNKQQGTPTFTCADGEGKIGPQCQYHVGTCSVKKETGGSLGHCITCAKSGPYCQHTVTAASKSSDFQDNVPQVQLIRKVSRMAACGPDATRSHLFTNGTHCGCACCMPAEKNGAVAMPDNNDDNYWCGNIVWT